METEVLKKIKILMIEREIETVEAAKQIGLHINYFRSIINGTLVPGKKTAVRIEEWSDSKIKAHELMRL